MHGFAVAGRQIVGCIHRGVGRDFQDQQFARTQQQYLHRRSRLMRRQRLGHEMADHGVKLAEVAQGLAGQRARERGVAGRQIFQRIQLTRRAACVFATPG